MILQNIIFFGHICKKRELFFRSDSRIQTENGNLMIPGGACVSFDSYMNIFDIKKWRELTDVYHISFEMEFEGKGRLWIFSKSKGKKRIVADEQLDSVCGGRLVVNLDGIKEEGYLCAEVEAKGKCVIKSMCFSTGDKPVQSVRLAAVICAYNKREEVLATIARLKGIEHLSLYVIDNKKELPEKKGKYLNIYRNENTGGSGGFTKGLEIIRKDRSKKSFSHVIFMDDDAYINPEAIKRTYSLLSYIRHEYSDNGIAGRMFLSDKPYVQYTASEIWNRGHIEHIGGNLDMSKAENLEGLNEGAGGEYSGFWFFCVPYSFAKGNTPLPFFLHCDDVEYGLRLGKEPIILNGIQAWHDNPLSKINPVMTYYDIRNAMIVNSLDYFGEKTKAAARGIYTDWKRKYADFREMHDFDSERMALLAMEHFLRGPGWVYRINGERLHKRLLSIKPVNSNGETSFDMCRFLYDKISYLKRKKIERQIKKNIYKAVKKYRKAGGHYANENL